MTTLKGGTTTAPYTIVYEATANGRNLVPGVELTISGVRGRCRFLAYVTHRTTGKSWIDAVDAGGRLRSFNMDRIKTVHRTIKTRGENT